MTGSRGGQVGRSELRRQLGLGSLTVLVVGQVIAVGIFLTPAGMARSLGSPLLLLAVWLAMGLMAVCGALCYGELAARFPEAGGGYVYLREAFGPGVSFLYGWKCLLVMDPGVTAALAAGLASYVGYLVGLSALELRVVAIGTVLVLAAVNVAGVRVGARLVGVLTALKLGALAVIVLLPVVLGLGDWGNFTPLAAQRPGSDPLIEGLAAGFVGAFFAFGGWWEVSKLAGEARDPERTVPRALVAGVSVVTVAYVLTSAAFIYLVPIEEVTSDQAFAAQAGEALFGPAGGHVFAVIVIVAVLGSLAVLLMALPRVYYAMARDGVFFRFVGAVDPRFDTPVCAIGIQAVLASLLVAAGTFDAILAYFIFVTVAFIALTVGALFVLRRRESDGSRGGEPHPDGGSPHRDGSASRADGGAARAAGREPRPDEGELHAGDRTPGDSASFRAPGYPVTPLVFLVLAAVLLFLLAVGNPLEAGLGVGVVMLGLPAYRLLFRGRPPD